MKNSFLFSTLLFSFLVAPVFCFSPFNKARLLEKLPVCLDSLSFDDWYPSYSDFCLHVADRLSNILQVQTDELVPFLHENSSTLERFLQLMTDPVLLFDHQELSKSEMLLLNDFIRQQGINRGCNFIRIHGIELDEDSFYKACSHSMIQNISLKHINAPHQLVWMLFESDRNSIQLKGMNLNSWHFCRIIQSFTKSPRVLHILDLSFNSFDAFEVLQCLKLIEKPLLKSHVIKLKINGNPWGPYEGLMLRKLGEDFISIDSIKKNHQQMRDFRLPLINETPLQWNQ